MRPHPRAGLIARLTLGVALLVLAAGALISTSLYNTLAAELARRDDIQLLGKINQIRLLLAQAGSAELILDQPQYFRDTMSGPENALVSLRQTDGTALIDINPERLPWQSLGLQPVPANLPLSVGAISDWPRADGAPARAVAAWAFLANGRDQVLISCARTFVERQRLLGHVRNLVIAATLAVTLLAALLAALLARRLLSPLQKLAGAAGSITVAHLEKRLSSADAPAELQPLVHALNAMLERLQKGFERLQQFSDDLAHEFRTPIGNLLGQTQVALSQARSNADYETLLCSNLEEFERLTRMIESMLFLARADHAGVEIALQTISAADELQIVADYFEGLADNAGIAITLAGDAPLQADPALLRRALANLVSNAIAHTPAGASLHLSAQRLPDSVRIGVANAGPPIAPQHLPYLFERFYRADPARREPGGSNGLGLAIVKSIMDLHGGRVEVDNPPQGPVQFILVFPLGGLRRS